jgi:predicted ATPase
MLTRLEVNGFKNLANLRVELGPFTCIAGENGAGKSNVFDAIQLLSLLADRSLMEAAQEVRSTRDQRTGDPRDLFWDGHQARSPQMAFAAEMIVPREIEDDFGRPAKASITFLRYEVEIGYEPAQGLEKIGRLVLLREQLRHINIGDAPSHIRFPHSVRDFRARVVQGRRSGQAFISTSDRGDDRIITIHQDGGSRGQPRPASAIRAPATVVSTVTGADDPTILAARREMQGWRRLALEPSALRAADRYTDPRVMGTDGRHLPATLFRIATTPEQGESAPHPQDIYARVAERLASLTGVSVRRLRVDADDARELLTIQLEEAGGIELPARSLSEGTLRFLGLCVLLEDTTVRGVICMEEPENGIHPANIPAMVQLAQDLAVDPSRAPDEDNPFRQVIINSHSPAVVQLVDPNNLLYASTAVVGRADSRPKRALTLRPLVNTWRATSPMSTEPPVGMADLLPYLTNPPGTQLRLDAHVA